MHRTAQKFWKGAGRAPVFAGFESYVVYILHVTAKKCADVSIDNISVLEFIYGNIQSYQNVISLR